jgi:hypothetical protein
VQGVALATSDGTPVADATVSAAGRTAKTAADGSFSFDGLPEGNVMVRLEASGFIDGVLPVKVDAAHPTRADVHLVREGATVTIDPSAVATVKVPGSSAAVDLAAGTLVVSSGAAPSGPVSVHVTPIDPSADPRSMPGTYLASDGESIESMGAISVSLQDATGQRVNLKAGARATIRIPLASRASDPPPTMALYHLDESTGRWLQEGSATLKTDNGSSYYEGTVGHFSIWNADRKLDSVTVHGCVTDAGAQAVQGVEVSSSGLDYSGVNAAGTTDAQGQFSVQIRKYGRASLQAQEDTRESASFVVGPSGADITLPTCLVLNRPAGAPVISQAPQNLTIWDGMPAFFQVVGSGGHLSYQWRRDGVDIPGATQEWLSLPKVALVDSGARFSVVVRNAVGSTTTTEATLTVTPNDAAAQAAHARLLGLALDFSQAAFAAAGLVGDNETYLSQAAVCSSGSASGTLDGASVIAGQRPPSSGTLAGTFDQCMTGGGQLSGSSVIGYTSSGDFDSIRAQATVQMRVKNVDAAFGGSTPTDTTARGGASAIFDRTSSNGSKTSVLTLAPGSGSTLRNETSGRTATFETGAFTTVWTVQDQVPTQSRLSYDSLRFTVDGIPYVANGSMQMTYSQGNISGSGEIRLQSNGATAARLFATDQGVFIEVNGSVLQW